jgi:hypothetical protein
MEDIIMKKHILFIAGILFFIYSMGQPAQRTQFYEGAGQSLEIGGGYDEPDSYDNETEEFLKAKELVFKSEWKEAQTQLGKYLKSYPSGNYRDEAFYWLAYCSNRMAVKEIDPENVISLLEEASNQLKVLSQEYPESLWQDDGQKLMSDITVVLDLMRNKEMKKIHLDALVDFQPEVAIPVFQNVLASPDPEIRKQAVSLLGRYFSSSAQELLKKVVRSDKDKDVRQEAEFLLERAGARKISARLNYQIYGCRLLDEDQYALFPEDKIRTIDLPPIESGDAEALFDAVREVFQGETSRLSSSANGQMPFSDYYSGGRELRITNRAGDYLIWFDQDKLRLSSRDVRGEVQFRHSETNKIFDTSFLLKKGDNKLIAMRSGDRLSLIILQFGVVKAGVETSESLEIVSHEPLFKDIWRKLAGTFGGDESVVHKAIFSDFMGWEIHSSKESWSLNEMAGKSGKYDFGRAEAVSKSPEGWKLIGNLSLVQEERRFVGRKAALLDPKDRIVAFGDEISVPTDRPSAYKAMGSRNIEEAGSGLPDYGILKVGGHFTLKPGVEIQTENEYYRVRDFEENLINFEQAKAILPEKGSPSIIQKYTFRFRVDVPDDVAFVNTHKPDRCWRLIGDIFWIKDQDRLIGSGAILTNPDREIKAQGLISVPIDDPAGFQILSGKSWKKKQLLLPEDERKTRYFYPTLSSNVQGWEVYSTLHSSDYTNKKKWDFSMAQATRHYNGRVWILIGHIILLRQEGVFLARNATLINSDGEAVWGAEIRVSTDNPSHYEVVKK